MRQSDILPAHCPLSTAQIMALIPHRAPMLFIDEVIEFSENTITTQTTLDPKSDFFKGHFPDKPLMPGVLILEMAGQAAALLIALSCDLPVGKFPAFSAVEKTRFKRPVWPNDKVTVKVELIKMRRGIYKFVATAEVVDIVVAIMEYTASEMAF